MVTAFDIFQTESDGVLLWRGSATSTDGAMDSVREFAKRSPGDYMIINLLNRKRFVIKSDGADLSSAAAG
jgi:hypothetical protein